jgi:hypothetical protein
MHENEAIRVLARAVKRDPLKFDEYVSKLVPARLLLSQLLVLLLEDAKAHNELMKQIVAFANTHKDEIRDRIISGELQ